MRPGRGGEGRRRRGARSPEEKFHVAAGRCARVVVVAAGAVVGVVAVVRVYHDAGRQRHFGVGGGNRSAVEAERPPRAGVLVGDHCGVGAGEHGGGLEIAIGNREDGVVDLRDLGEAEVVHHDRQRAVGEPEPVGARFRDGRDKRLFEVLPRIFVFCASEVRDDGTARVKQLDRALGAKEILPGKRPEGFKRKRVNAGRGNRHVRLRVSAAPTEEKRAVAVRRGDVAEKHGAFDVAGLRRRIVLPRRPVKEPCGVPAPPVEQAVAARDALASVDDGGVADNLLEARVGNRYGNGSAEDAPDVHGRAAHGERPGADVEFRNVGGDFGERKFPGAVLDDGSRARVGGARHRAPRADSRREAVAGRRGDRQRRHEVYGAGVDAQRPVEVLRIRGGVGERAASRLHDRSRAGKTQPVLGDVAGGGVDGARFAVRDVDDLVARPQRPAIHQVVLHGDALDLRQGVGEHKRLAEIARSGRRGGLVSPREERIGRAALPRGRLGFVEMEPVAVVAVGRRFAVAVEAAAVQPCPAIPDDRPGLGVAEIR